LGRKYGRLEYGRYTYDLDVAFWDPVLNPLDPWVPESAPSLVELWASTAPISVEWTPEPQLDDIWDEVVVPVEIWIPVTHPKFGMNNG
jgi:hypothetical protein